MGNLANLKRSQSCCFERQSVVSANYEFDKQLTLETAALEYPSLRCANHLKNSVDKTKCSLPVPHRCSTVVSAEISLLILSLHFQPFFSNPLVSFAIFAIFLTFRDSVLPNHFPSSPWFVYFGYIRYARHAKATNFASVVYFPLWFCNISYIRGMR